MPHYKSTICVDFDGVIHSYESGWKGETVIPDRPVTGAIEWLEMMVELGDFHICIYSSRSKYEGGIEAMKQWLKYWGLSLLARAKLDFPTQKPAASMTIDDRAFCFEGDFPSPSWLRSFVPWNKRANAAPVVPNRSLTEDELEGMGG